MKPLLIAALSSLVLVIPVAGHAATDLILNGSFEYEMGAWSCTPGNACTLDDTIAPHSGVLGMLLHDGTGTAVLSQSFETVVGAVYDLSFWVKWTEPTAPGQQAWWSAGDVAMGQIAGVSGDFAQIVARFVASSDTTTLSFNAHTPGAGSLALDDISVTEGTAAPSPVPVPAPALMLGLGLGGLAALRRRIRS